MGGVYMQIPYCLSQLASAGALEEVANGIKGHLYLSWGEAGFPLRAEADRMQMEALLHQHCAGRQHVLATCA